MNHKSLQLAFDAHMQGRIFGAEETQDAHEHFAAGYNYAVTNHEQVMDKETVIKNMIELINEQERRIHELESTDQDAPVRLNDQYAKDAARYRWVLKNGFNYANNPNVSDYHKGGIHISGLYLNSYDHAGLNSAIDAAKAAAPKQEKGK